MFIATWVVMEYGIEGYEPCNSEFYQSDTFEYVVDFIQQMLDMRNGTTISDVHIYEVKKEIRCKLVTTTKLTIES